MKIRPVLILERSSQSLTTVKDDKKYMLEGVFCEFGKENNNKRIYEEKEYLPHLEYLQKKIQAAKLLGELDHPDKMEVNLSKVSHMVEELRYDEKNRQILGKIKILNTSAGKDARAMIDDGVQLSISSRSAGVVNENKTVSLKKIITYDLVAEPGFDNAGLKNINEEIGLTNDSNLLVFECLDSRFMLAEETQTSTAPSTELEDVRTRLYNLNEELISKVEHLSKLEEKINEMETILQNRTTDEAIEKSKVFEEKTTDFLNITSDFLDKAAGEINETNTYLVDFVIPYMRTLADTQKDIIKENKNIIRYCNNIAEYVDKDIQYTEKVAAGLEDIKEYVEEVVTGIEYLAEYAGEFLPSHLDEATRDIEALQERLERISTGEVEAVKETKTVNLDDKINLLLENHIQRKDSQIIGFNPYVNLLTEGNREMFNSLTAVQREKFQQRCREVKPINEHQVMMIIQGLGETNTSPAWLELIPESYRPIWEGLSEMDKEKIKSRAQFYQIETPYQVRNFWETDPVVNRQAQMLKESLSPDVDETNKTNPGVQSVLNALKKMKQ